MSNKLKKIFNGTLKNIDNNLHTNNILEISLFSYLYKRYTNFSKEIIDEIITNKSFDEKIRVKVNNYGDFLGHITLCITLPEVYLDNLISTSYTDVDITEEKTLLDDYDNYIYYILIVYRIISNKLLLVNITSKNIYDEINTIFNSTNEDFIDYNLSRNKISYEFILKNTDIKNNIINIYTNNTGVLLDNDIISLMKIELENILANIKLYHKLYYYNQYKILLEKKTQNDIKKYNFSWIENIGRFLVKEVSFIINNKKIETLYSDWLNIWDELTLNKKQKEGNNILLGNIKSLTTYNNDKKEEFDIYLSLNFWFNRKSNIYLPLLLLNYDDIFIDITFDKLTNCIYTDYSKDEVDQIENIIKIKEIKLLYEYYYLDDDEKKNLKLLNYKSIINIIDKKVNKISLNNIIDNNKTKNYEYISNFFINFPLSELILIIQSDKLINTYNLKNNYYGITSIDTTNNKYYKVNDNKITTLNNLQIIINNNLLNNINNIEYYNKITSYKYHNNIIDYIYLYTFSLFPENSQASGHINLSINNNFQLKLTFNNKFIDFLDTEFNGEDTIIISLYLNLYKEFNIINGQLIY